MRILRSEKNFVFSNIVRRAKTVIISDWPQYHERSNNVSNSSTRSSPTSFDIILEVTHYSSKTEGGGRRRARPRALPPWTSPKFALLLALASPTALTSRGESKVAHVLVSQIVASIITLVEAAVEAAAGLPRSLSLPTSLLQLQTEKLRGVSERKDILWNLRWLGFTFVLVFRWFGAKIQIVEIVRILAQKFKSDEWVGKWTGTQPWHENKKSVQFWRENSKSRKNLIYVKLAWIFSEILRENSTFNFEM